MSSSNAFLHSHLQFNGAEYATSSNVDRTETTNAAAPLTSIQVLPPTVQIGHVVSRDEPIEQLAARLYKHGVEVSDIIESTEANYMSFTDQDGNPIYVGDWDPGLDEELEPHDAVGSTTL